MPHLADEVTQFIRAILNRMPRSGSKRWDEILIFAEKLDDIDERVASTQKSLDKFAGAIEVYAGHLASHTSAIRDLSRSAAELRESSAEQNRVLARITENLLTQKTPPVTVTPHLDETTSTSEFVEELKRRTDEARRIRYGLQGLFVKDIKDRTAAAWEAARYLDTLVGIHHVEGCNVRHPINYREQHPSGLN
jgi:chromosome segregation ATPase